MTEAQSREFKKKYNHCKIRIKEWETNFVKENGRCPDKSDIKEAEPKIKEYYKTYWHLKSCLLEEQILGNVSEEKPEVGNTLKESCQFNISKRVESYENPEMRVVQSGNIEEIKKGNSLDSSKVAAKCQNVVSQSKKTLEAKKWMKSASSKLFEGSSFKRRNPRKALQKKSVQELSSSALSDSYQDSFISEMSFQSCASPLPDTCLPETSFSVESEVSPKIRSLIESSVALSPLFSSTNKLKIISASENEPQQISNQVALNAKPKAVRKLDVGWVERCVTVAEKSLEEGRISLDSGFESTSGSISSPTLENPLAVSSNQDSISDDELICDSDDESCSQILSTLKRKVSCLDNSSQHVADIPNCQEAVKKVKLDDPVVANNTYSNPKNVPTLVRNSLNNSQVTNIPSRLHPAVQLKKDILEKKINSGTVNDNYVKINVKKKVFVRGKKSFNFGKHKKSEWKKKKRELNAYGEIGGVLKCFKCGDVGHFARFCQSGKEDKLLPVDETLDEDDLGLPSLAEAEEMAREAAMSLPVRKKCINLRMPKPVDQPPDLPDLEGVPFPRRMTTVPALHSSEEEVRNALLQFGHSEFRPGQEQAIMRILAGKSTLLMLSTGGGKSLCYQLPALLYHRANGSIALVVSPLVSLMDDQVASSLTIFKLGCLHTNQTEKQRAKVVSLLENSELTALLVSPEAVVSCDSFGFGSTLKKLPPIAFACIDEVHCVSQWSYNFRSSYLMLTKVLRERLNVRTFLGLTATASKTTIASIVNELGIEDETGVIQDTPLPINLTLKISRVSEKDAALLELVQASNGAVLVYCTRREECVRLATLIRTSLRSVTAEAYHAGLVASRRKSVQRSFMQGKLQVVVATVAFGMGINKQNIRRVFHYNMPKDWESYVQEVGRAGRDGQPAECHLLLDPQGSDLQELRRHIYSDSVERPVLRRLLTRVFVPCKCLPGQCAGHEVAFSAAETVTALDLPEENISTLLCYLELHEDKLIQMMTPAYMTCKVQSYHGARGMHRAARECPPLAVAAAQAEEGNKASCLTFDVVKLARQIGWDSGTVKRHLKQTEWRREKNGTWRRSGMHVTFSDLGLRVHSRGDLSEEQLDEALEYLVQRVEGQQNKALTLLHTVYSSFTYFSTEHHSSESAKKSDEIKEAIRMYFKMEKMPDHIPLLEVEENKFDEELVASDVRHLVVTFRDNNFNGRAVARIFHGIQSPNYPASVWFRARQWRAHLDKPFHRLQQIATREILKLK